MGWNPQRTQSDLQYIQKRGERFIRLFWSVKRIFREALDRIRWFPDAMLKGRSEHAKPRHRTMLTSSLKQGSREIVSSPIELDISEGS
jgi:hypothetical protein